MPAEVDVTFEPPGVTVRVAPGTRVLEAARSAGVRLSASCGGRGTCGDCAVKVLAGELAPPSEYEAASLAGAPAGVRLACLARVTGPLTLRPLGVATGAATETVPVVTEEPLVAAVDLGTTTVTARVFTVAGRPVGEASVANAQRAWGGDVASRLSAAVVGDAAALRAAAAETVREALSAAGARSEARLERIVLAGNTVMAHLALGAAVAGLAVHPYTPSIAGLVRLPAAEALPGLPWAAAD
jgi:uncharacterized 2Fe-2S/4Fe-4S cluster protein (DUF4445 family)